MVDQPPTKITDHHKRLWDALNEFVRSNGGWLVSAPGEKWLRVEVPRDSLLPSRLIECGYGVRAAGITTLVTANGLMPTEIISFTLPGK